MNTKLQIAMIKHRTAKDIVLSFFDIKNKDSNKALTKKTPFTVLLGETFKTNATIEEVIKTVKKVGVWGYCHHTEDKDYKEIHYWFGKNATPENLIETFAHEISHAIGVKNELRAQRYGKVALFAYAVLKDEKLIN
jgi:hypothetical protein